MIKLDDSAKVLSTTKTMLAGLVAALSANLWRYIRNRKEAYAKISGIASAQVRAEDRARVKLIAVAQQKCYMHSKRFAVLGRKVDLLTELKDFKPEADYVNNLVGYLEKNDILTPVPEALNVFLSELDQFWVDELAERKALHDWLSLLAPIVASANYPKLDKQLLDCKLDDVDFMIKQDLQGVIIGLSKEAGLIKPGEKITLIELLDRVGNYVQHNKTPVPTVFTPDKSAVASVKQMDALVFSTASESPSGAPSYSTPDNVSAPYSEFDQTANADDKSLSDMTTRELAEQVAASSTPVLLKEKLCKEIHRRHDAPQGAGATVAPSY